MAISASSLSPPTAFDRMHTGTYYFGIDPGTTATGYGIIMGSGNTVRWVDSGAIAPPPAALLPEKLASIYSALCERMAAYGPGCVCIEEAFYAKNVRTTLILGHARGVALLAAHTQGWRVAEYSPREIKKSVVGKGNATKDQVAYMVTTLLAPPPDKRQTDACDALAAALCGFYHLGSPLRVKI